MIDFLIGGTVGVVVGGIAAVIYVLILIQIKGKNR